MSPRKIRLVAGLIRGLDVAKAESQLGFSVKAAARPVLKLLRSAIANAEHNHKLEREGLYIKVITVDGGPMLKRWRARAFGRAAPIRKRTSHITIILSDKEAADGKKTGLKAALVKQEAKDKKKPAVKKTAKKVEKKALVKKTPAKKVEEKKEEKKSVAKKAVKKVEKKEASPSAKATGDKKKPTTKKTKE
jgi:large subunit ribosomal protein L22